MMHTKIRGLYIEYNKDKIIIYEANQIKDIKKMELILNKIQNKQIDNNKNKIQYYIKKWKRLNIFNKISIFKKHKLILKNKKQWKKKKR